MTHDTQCLRIQRHLAKGHSLTPLSAFRKFGTLRLSGRIHDLREAGWTIETELVSVGKGKHVARYFMPRARGGR